MKVVRALIQEANPLRAFQGVVHSHVTRRSNVANGSKRHNVGIFPMGAVCTRVECQEHGRQDACRVDDDVAIVLADELRIECQHEMRTACTD